MSLYLQYDKIPSMWATVTFYNVAPGNTLMGTASVLIGTPIPAASVPTTSPPSGYASVWYTSSARTTAWTMTANVTGNLDLYLQYDPTSDAWANVRFFNASNVQMGSTIQVLKGTAIPAASVPTTTPPTGYQTVWYTSSARTTVWTMTANVTGDLDLYLRYDKIPSMWADVIFYNTSNVKIGDTVSVLIGTPIPAASVPAVSPPNANIAVWYTTPARATAWTMTANVTGNMSLYLSYVPDPAASKITVTEIGGTGTVTYSINGGTAVTYAAPFHVYNTDSVSFTTTGTAPSVFELWLVKGNAYSTATTSGHSFSSDSTVYVLYYKGGTEGTDYVKITKGDHKYGDIRISVAGTPLFDFPASGFVRVTKGTAVGLSAEPDTGYVFCCWYGGITGDVTPYSFDGSKSITVNALFYKDGVEGDDYVVISKGDCDNGDIYWSPDGTNFYPFPPSGELNVTKGDKIFLKPVPDDGYGFVHWTDDIAPTENNPYEFDCSESITAGAVFDRWHTVTVRSGSGASLGYTITVKDPLTGDDVVIGTGTFAFGPRGGSAGISIPDGASLAVSVTSDHGDAAIEWDDGNPLVRQFGPVYTQTVRSNMTVTLIIESDEETPFPWWIVFFGLIFLLIFLDDDEEEIYGKVRYKGKGLFAVTIGYTLNGGERKTVRTDKDGDYEIPADKGDTVVITDVTKSKSSVTKDLPMEIPIKGRTKVDFEF
jgi:hypothetical protein